MPSRPTLGTNSTTKIRLRPSLKPTSRGGPVSSADFREHHIDGITHGIGLRFEEIPTSTILKHHRNVALREGMTVTIGHTILAEPGFGGVRHEDVYRVTPDGGCALVPYPVAPVV
jgi:Xaa-Pro aminopeptidase